MTNSSGGGRARGSSGPNQRTPLQKVFYWTAVAGVWGAIVVVIVLLGLAWDLPSISKLDKITRQLDGIEKRLRAGLMLAAG